MVSDSLNVNTGCMMVDLYVGEDDVDEEVDVIEDEDVAAKDGTSKRRSLRSSLVVKTQRPSGEKLTPL